MNSRTGQYCAIVSLSTEELASHDKVFSHPQCKLRKLPTGTTLIRLLYTAGRGVVPPWDIAGIGTRLSAARQSADGGVRDELPPGLPPAL